MNAEKVDVILIVTPFVTLERPSISLGTLKAGLTRHDISSEVVYGNMLFAETIGIKNYHFISNFSSELQIGEWVFSGGAFPEFNIDSTPYLEACGTVNIDMQLMQDARAKVSSFLDVLVERILQRNPRIVGCSSVFQQHCASLAILRRIHERAPHIITMMGGANCEGSMGVTTHQNFEWVDYLVAGEADELLPPLCLNILEKGRDVPPGELTTGVLGPWHRENSIDNAYPTLHSARVEDVDTVPIPDYHDYFKALENFAYKDNILPGIPVESSRGCWWGQKLLCSFCSLNGETNIYRSKSTQRVMDELDHLVSTYRTNYIEMVDNILDMKYFKSLIPGLVEQGGRYNILFESKSNLKKEQIQLLAKAGIRWIQSGIESLHDDVLVKLKKGNSSWINIQLLKWAAESGIYLIWNFLVNAPGEKDEWYQEMCQWLPLLSHLQAPTGKDSHSFRPFQPLPVEPRSPRA